MKNFKLLKTLLVLIGILIGSVSTQMWGWTIYLYTGSFTSWEQDGDETFQVWDGSTNHNLTSLGNHWYSGSMGSFSSGTVWVKRCAPNYGREYNSFSVSVSSTNYVTFVSGWTSGGLLTYYIKHPWNGGDWTWQTMTFNSANTFKYTGIYKSSNGANVNQDKGDSNYLTPSNASNVNDKVPAIWTYTPSSNSLRIDPAYTLTVNVDSDTKGSASGSQSKGIKMSTKYAISASNNTGYHFNNWTRVSGGTCAFDNASNASTYVTVTGDASATVRANFAENSYSITFANDGHGTVEVADAEISSGSSASVNHFTTKKLEGIASSGYHFSSWTLSGTNTDKVTIADKTSTGATTTIKATDTGATVTANFAGNTHSVKLHDNNGDAHSGSATATYDSDELDISSIPEKSGYEVEGYYLSDGTTKVANADGSLVDGDVSGYVDGGVWIYDYDDAVLYAKWTVVASTYTLTFAVGTDYTSHGTVSATVGGSAASSGSAYNENSTVRVTASPNTGYRVKGWYTDAACNSEISGTGAPGTASLYPFTLTGNTTVYVAFEQSKTTITLDGNTGTSGDASVIATHGSALPSFTKHTKSGYTLNGYYTATSGGSKIINADGTLAASTSYTDASSHWNSDERTLTLHAQWTENTVTLTPTVSYDAGSSSYTASASNSIGVSTDSQIKCSKPNSSHYTFAGWTLTNLTVTSGTASTDTIIRVKVTTPGSPVSAVAKYNEVLTQSTWVLKGGTYVTGDNWSTKHAMSKKSGASTSDVVYYRHTINKTNSGIDGNTFSFKIVKNDAGGDDEKDTWYGLGEGSGEWWYYHNSGEQTLGTSNKNIQIIANSAGEYEIKLDYSNPSSLKVTVEFPSQFIKGTWDSWTEHAFDKDGIYRVSLPAGKTYEFCVNYKSDIYKKTKTITATTYDETFNTSDDNCNLTTGAAGIYTFGWNGTDKKLSVIFPGDTAKSMFSKNEYIYFDTRRLGSTTGWNQVAFSSRFWVKYYASGVDYDHIDCAIADTVEQGIYYVKVPADRLGQIQINRMATDFSSIYNTAAKVYAFDRSATTKNCLIEQTGHENDWNGWQPQWSSTTYCPPMKTAVLEDNGTIILAGGGTKANPYQIAVSSKIKVTAASSTAFNDDAHMTHKYHFYNGASSLADQTDATYEFDASSSTNETYEIVVMPYNTYNSQSSTKRIKSDTIYYKTVPSYTITYNDNGAHSGTAPVDGNRYIYGATPTTLGNSGSLAKEGYTFNGWNESAAGNGTHHDVETTITIGSSNVELFAEWIDDHTYYFYGGEDGTGTAWNTAANWTKGAVPNDIANTIYIMKPVEIPADATIRAAAVNIVTGGTYTRPYNRGTVSAAGHLSINGGGGLIISGALRRVESATALSTKTYTREEDLHIGSTKEKGNGVLIMGTHDGANQATVEFYTKSHGDLAANQRVYAVNQFIGTPFNDCNDITYNYHNSWVYSVDYTGTPTWKRVNGGEGMNAFEGYSIISADAADHVYWMGGTLVASTDQSLSLHNNSSTTTENLLANSWMGPIVIGAFQASDFTNCSQTIYIFNAGSPNDRSGDQFGNAANNNSSAGQYTSIPINLSPFFDNYKTIPSMQSFSIKADATSSSASLALNYNRLVYSLANANGITYEKNHAPRRAGEDEEIPEMEKPDMMKLYVNGESGYRDMVWLVVREDFTDGFEDGWEAEKLYGEDMAPQMYALSEAGEMSIDAIANMEGTVIAFRKGTEDTNYTFTFNYDGDGIWYLNDLKEQTSTLISEIDTYTFTSMTGDNAARFVISHTPIANTPTAIENGGAIDGANVRKLMIDGTLYIIRGGQMFTADGQVVK